MVPVERLLSLFPPGLLRELAVALEVDAPNQVRLPGEAVFLCLLHTLASHPVATQRLLEETYTQLYGRPADHSSFGARLARLDPAYFQALLTHLHRRLEPLFATGAGRGLRLRRVDATTVTTAARLLRFGLLQRAGNREGSAVHRHVKVVLTLEEGDLPAFLHLCREPCEANDNGARGDPMVAAAAPGDLWVFARGCKDRDRLLQLHAQHAFWVTPHAGQKWRVLRVVWVEEQPEATRVALKEQAATAARQQPKAPAPCRLRRVEQVVFENAQDAKHPSWQAKWAQLPVLVLHAERYSHRLQRWEPLVLLTNLPLCPDGCHAGPFRLAEVPEVYRDRWDIEGLFKFLKQHLGYEHLVSFHPNGIHLMVLMTLIMALLLLWYRRETGIDRGWRSVKAWFAYDARQWTETLLRVAWDGPGGRRRADGVAAGVPAA
jgi:hypothetical protein